MSFLRIFPPSVSIVTAPLPAAALSLTSTSPDGPNSMNRGRAKPDAHSSAKNPSGNVNFAASGRAITFGGFAASGVANGGGKSGIFCAASARAASTRRVLC